MMGKVSTDESRNEISSSPGPPSVVAKATIFTFHTFNQENKYPPIHLECHLSRAKSSGGSTPLLRPQPYLRLRPYHTSLCALCASVLNPFLSFALCVFPVLSPCPSSLSPLCASLCVLCVHPFLSLLSVCSPC